MRVAVIGAGVTGLVAAYRLTCIGHRCDVFERWPGLGGQVATLDVGAGDPLERYYHHLFTSDRHIAALYEELGMSEAIEWLPSSVAIFAEGRAYSFTSPLDLLRFDPLTLQSRLRMGAYALWVQRRHRHVEPFEHMTARAWVERSMGNECWRQIWGPLLRGKFGERAEDVSAAWLWAKLAVRRQIKGREARQELLGYPRGGWQPLLERLRSEIEHRGGRVLIDRPAARIERVGESFMVSAGAPDSFRRGHDPREFAVDGGLEDYDAVIVTVPGDIFTRLLGPDLRAGVGDAYLDRIRSIEYQTALCLLLELDRPFSSYYWMNIADDELPFVGLIEHTNLVDPARYGGRRFLYVANYLEATDPLLKLGPDEVLNAYLPGLRAVNPAFSPGWVHERWAFKEPAAQPIVTVGYRERIPPFETGVPGLVLANTTQIYPEDRGTNYSVRLGGEAVSALLSSKATPRFTVGSHAA